VCVYVSMSLRGVRASVCEGECECECTCKCECGCRCELEYYRECVRVLMC